MNGHNTSGLQKDVVPFKLLYITPERLTQSADLIQTLIEMNDRKQIARLVVDEAHCISE